MARNNNYRRRAGNYARRAGGYFRRAGGYAYRGFRRGAGYAYRGARRAGGYAVRYQRRANRGFGPNGFKVYPDMPLGAGILVGLTNLDRQIPGEVILAGAAAPIGGKWGRSVRNFAGGVVIGELISKATGKVINFPAQQKTESLASMYV